MNLKPIFVLSLTAATLSAALAPAQAQRAPVDPQERRQQRQQMLQNMTPEQRAQWRQNQRQQRYEAASPEERTRMDARRAERAGGANAQDLNSSVAGAGQASGRSDCEAQMRALMNASGITDKATQDPIIAFVFRRDRQRQPVLALAREVATALRPTATQAATTSVTDRAATTSVTDRVATATAPASSAALVQKFAAYQAALEQDKARATDELAALDKQIRYSSSPRLQAFLSLVGILNPDALVLGGATTIFAPAPAPNSARPVANQSPA